MFKNTPLVKKLNRIYDQGFSASYHSEFFNGSGFSNFGYWDKSTINGEEAANQLIDKLISNLPKDQSKILDVACGQGGTTKRLSNHFPSAEITGINISEKQLDEARLQSKKCRFVKMNAEVLDFGDNYFDSILCTEAAFHFKTRESFFKEAWRVLKPGGSLIMTDIIFRFVLPSDIIPSENHVKDITAYKKLLKTIGYCSLSVDDSIKETWKSCRNRLIKWLLKRAYRGNNKRTAGRDLCTTLIRSLLYDIAFKHYILIHAQKEDSNKRRII